MNFVELIRSQQGFLLTGHERPDGDCLGAQVALFHLLKALGKDVVIVNPDPITKTHDFLTRHTPFQTVNKQQPLPPFGVAVLLDCCQLSRLGELGPRIRNSGAVIAVIDHHVGSDRADGQVCYVDSTAAATGALVRRLYREFGVPLQLPAAEGVFLSLVSDTGWFRYSNTDVEVLSLAAELIGLGVNSSVIYDHIYRRMHPESVEILVAALGRHKKCLGGKLAMVCLDRNLADHASRVDFDTDAVIDPLRSLEGVEVVAILKERFDGAIRLSLRAKGDVDVQSIAAAFGGGGHRKAAGASIAMSLSDAALAVEEQARKAIEAVFAKERV
ncbi:MAG: bifunctional oligoribonuclease/PAP phosphatase NrnA [Planctomycetota bacterium]|nr:bifunctional oligoribonuclease/PAP phosphatase NrnA [Planctomycetota bacterium]